MKCERCGKELADVDLYCPRCGKAVFEKYMDEEDVWAYYKSDEELARILEEEEKKGCPTRKPGGGIGTCSGGFAGGRERAVASP